VDLAYVDQGYTGERPAAATREHGIALEVVKLPEAKRDLVLLPQRWVAEHTFAWATRFGRLVRDYERLYQTLADMHLNALACLRLQQAASYTAVHNSLQTGPCWHVAEVGQGSAIVGVSGP
jgi:transposase